MRRALPLIAAVAVAAAALLASADTSATTSASAPAAGRTVTLLTGDRVRVTGDGLLVEPGDGRHGMTFSQYEVDGHEYVVPVDAVAMVGSGRLDRRLFDVTTLLDMGYDDASRPDLPLIVTGGGARAAGGRALSSVNGAAVRVPAADRAHFWSSVHSERSAGRTVWLDGKRHVSLDQSVPQIGAPTAWQAGYTGRGVTVAVLDTGVTADHPDLAGRVSESRNFTDDPDSTDNVGHGTHVASILAGSGAASGGRYRGVAPEATVLSGKVCTIEGCPESAILAGMEWAAASGATVVNMSLGGPDFAGLDPVEQAVNTLTERYGVLFVTAAGNSGQGGPRTVESPGSADAALTVGAVDRQDVLADFSSRGPRTGDDAIKPDLTAPGVGIVAARAAGTPDGDQDPVDADYTRLSGTSMATPHVAGAAVLLAQQHPDWRADNLKAALAGTASPAADRTPFEQGSGRVDVARAVTQTVRAEPASLSMGLQRWPHTDDEPITRTVTYHNDGPATVTLSLAAEITGPNGQAVPEGMFRLRPAEITVSPGAEQTVTITADTSVPGSDGGYTGAMVATGDGQRVRTTLAVDREPESYDLTLTHLDRTGAATSAYGTSIDGVAEPFAAWPYDPDGTVIIRLPRGRYNLDTVIAENDGVTASKLLHPLVDLTADMTITLDARTAEPIAVTVPRPAATQLITAIGYYRRLAGGNAATTLFSFDGTPIYSAQSGPVLPADELTGRVLSWWGEPDENGQFGAGSHLYNLAWHPPGRMPTGFTRQVREPDLAVVRADYRAQATGATGERTARPSAPGWQGTLGFVTAAPLPMIRTEYYTTDAVEWSDEFTEITDDDGYRAGQSAGATTYRPGWQTVSWGAAPFGPSLPAADVPWLNRTGNVIQAFVPLFSDREKTHAGWSVVDSRQEALYRDDEPVPGGYGRYEVPPGPADYRFEVTADRGPGFALSTSVSCVWTFRSGSVPDGQPTALPATAIRFTPALDTNDAAPAGRSFPIPVHLQRQPGTPATTTLTVDVSYDDGDTWQPARISGAGDHRIAHVTHPDTAGFVSIRTEATDTAGNTVRQTIIHAYRLHT